MNALRMIQTAAMAASLSVCLSAVGQTMTGAPPASATGSSSSESLGQRISDGTITTKAKAELIAAKQIKSSRIHVTTRHGVVSLTGTVPNDAEKQRAQAVVADISGVRSVDNRLEVR